MIFKDKICWITGASSGIGEALAYELASQGAKLIISSNDPNELERVRSKCLTINSFCEAVPFDLSNPIDVKLVAKNTVKRFGPIFLLINNGGISQRSLVVDTPIEIDRKIFEIDFFSYIAITKEVLPA